MERGSSLRRAGSHLSRISAVFGQLPRVRSVIKNRPLRHPAAPPGCLAATPLPSSRRVNENDSTRHPLPKPPLQGRLNYFQKTMLDWNDLHAYNAVHGVRIFAAPDLPALQHAIRDTLAFHGLSRLTLDRKKGMIRYTDAPAPCEVKVLACAANPPEILRAEIERQINTGFAMAETFQPFRFFIVREKESFWLGLAYFHAVADAVAIVQLLQEICQACQGAARPHGAEKFHLARTGWHCNPIEWARQVAGFFSQLRQQRRSVRVMHSRLNDGRNRFEQLTLGPDTLPALAAAAKSWDVTINDIFLAVLLVCCSPFTRHRFNHPSRRRIGLGCIVNTRGDLGRADPHDWGLFLGSFLVSHETPDGVGLRELAQDIRLQTRDIKRRKAYAGPPVELALGRYLLSFFSTEYRPKLYQKHYPLWGGITNMNLNSLWPQPPGAQPLQYFRGVSTGPVTPLVLSVTTAGAVMNVGLTFRATTFTDAQIGEVKKLFLQSLEPANLRA